MNVLNVPHLQLVGKKHRSTEGSCYLLKFIVEDEGDPPTEHEAPPLPNHLEMDRNVHIKDHGAQRKQHCELVISQFDIDLFIITDRLSLYGC